MARPLPEKQIVKMDLTVSTLDGSKKLGKQVGYNKYRTQEDKNEIVMLVEKLEKKGDALLILEDHGKDKPVIKIVENLFHTADKPYGYILDDEGKVVFLDEEVNIYDVSPDEKDNEKMQEAIDNRDPGENVNIDSYSSNIDHINIPNVEDSVVNMNINKTEEGNDPNIANNGITNNGEAVFTIKTDATMGTNAILTSGDPAETTIQGGK